MLNLLLRRPLALGLGLTTSALAAYSLFLSHSQFSRPLRCESAAAGGKIFGSLPEQDTKVPIIKDGRLNRAAYSQISRGSIIGLVAGIAVSTFSRTLAFVIGLMVLGTQYMASKGINVVPTERIQKYVKGIDLKSLLEDNVAFKMSFGATFLLAAFAEFR